MKNGLSIVFSTRKVDLEYVEHIKATAGCPVQVLPFENNGSKSLTEIYNESLSWCKYEVVVFCHDDLIFENKGWGNNLLAHFRRNPGMGIIGIAGSNHLEDGKWWTRKESMHGIVNHTDGKKKWSSTYSAPQGIMVKRMLVVDGLFFAAHVDRIKHTFDEDFKGFHFYDISFSFQNHLAGVKVGVVTDIRVTHMSIGETNDMWEENKQLFEEKYKDHLPKAIFTIPVK